MTKLEAFQKVVLAQIEVDAAILELALEEAGIAATDTFAKGDLAKLEIAAIPLLLNLTSVNSISEGGFSVSYDIEGMKTRLLYFAKKHGYNQLTGALNGQPKISSGKLW